MTAADRTDGLDRMPSPAALDPVDRLLLDELGDLPSGRIAVLDDDHGHLAEAVADQAGSGVVAACDNLLSERRLLSRTGVAVVPDLESALVGAQLVVLRLPKALDALDEIARTAARVGASDVRLVAGGRNKHMTPSMNAVLGKSFGDVHASLGRQKSRVLHAAGAKAVDQPWPRHRHHGDLDLTVYAHGAAFAGARVDAGTALLISQLHQLTDTEGTVVDLGCGTGILAALLARRFSDVLAIDVSAAAVSSARLTTGGAVEVRRADGLTELADASVAAVVSNPPFHIGAAKDSTATLAMITDAGRVLVPGGELVLVFNAHLPYLSRLGHLGRTDILARDRHYIVTRTIRR